MKVIVITPTTDYESIIAVVGLKPDETEVQAMKRWYKAYSIEYPPKEYTHKANDFVRTLHEVE